MGVPSGIFPFRFHADLVPSRRYAIIPCISRRLPPERGEVPEIEIFLSVVVVGTRRCRCQAQPQQHLVRDYSPLRGAFGNSRLRARLIAFQGPLAGVAGQHFEPDRFWSAAAHRYLSSSGLPDRSRGHGHVMTQDSSLLSGIAPPRPHRMCGRRREAWLVRRCNPGSDGSRHRHGAGQFRSRNTTGRTFGLRSAWSAAEERFVDGLARVPNPEVTVR